MVRVISYINNFFKPYIATIFIVCMALNMVGFMDPLPSELRMALSIAVIISYLINGAKYRSSFLLFIAYLAINVFLTNPDPIFKPWERLSYFIAVFLVVSPTMKGEYPAMIRSQALKILLFTGLILTILSLIGFPLGINMMKFEDETIDASERMYEAGGFSGFFNQSMILGPMAAISACLCLICFLRTKIKSIILLTLFCVLAVMIASSRTSFIAMIISMIVLLYQFVNNKQLFFKYMIIISFVLTFTYPLWEKGMGGLESKGDVVTETGFSSRTEKWNNRIEEFNSSPILGVGFSSANKKFIGVRNTTGVIEPGSSWLATASMTGIIGLLWVLSFFLKAYIILREKKQKETPLLGALLVFISIHMISEGYIYAAGSVMCVCAWLILGRIYDLEDE